MNEDSGQATDVPLKRSATFRYTHSESQHPLLGMRLSYVEGAAGVAVTNRLESRGSSRWRPTSQVTITLVSPTGDASPHLNLQIEQHLTLAPETGYQASEKPIGEAIVDPVLSKQIDDLEPTLTRHGYTAKFLAEMLGTKPAEIKAMFKQNLEADRARDLKEKMLAAGLPV